MDWKKNSGGAFLMIVTLRPYQERCRKALYALVRNGQIKMGSSGIIKCPAGGGKTIIGAAALADLAAQLTEPKTGFWIANTNDQLDQAQEALDLFPIIKERIKLTVCCYASMPDCTGAAVIVLDECHHIASPENRKILQYTPAKTLVWGFTATPHRADEFAADVFTLIGPIIETVQREELVDAGNLAKGRVIFHSPNHSKEIVDTVEKLAIPLFGKWNRYFQMSRQEYENNVKFRLAQELGVFKNDKRNAEILRIAGQHSKDSMLILVGSIEHGDNLKAGIPDSLVAHSKMGGKNRRIAMERFRAGELKCLIATSLADEGLDLPIASVLILAAGGRSAAKAEQRTGRVLRAWGDKTHGIIHDFTDDHHYFLNAQARARAKLYKSLGYEIEMEK